MTDQPHMGRAEVAALIDHTLLRMDAAERDIVTLCREAVNYGFPFVCVNPAWVRVAAARVAGSAVGVCSVAGFPLGATSTEAKVCEARRAVADGAREIDMVMHVGALRSGALEIAAADIADVVRASRHEGNAIVKVIIEAACLTDEQKITACQIARDAGAAFVKTSTGFGPGGATIADVALMRRTVGGAMGVKAAGGIRDLDTLAAMVAAGANRIGTSAGVEILLQAEALAR